MQSAIDKLGNSYSVHPYSKYEIINFKIPFFEEAVDLTKQMALVTPEIRYTAWDISITPSGPVVIEGNQFPGHDVYQSKLTLAKDKIGLLPKFNSILKKNSSI